MLAVTLDPCRDHRQHVGLLRRVQSDTFGQAMPFLQAAPAACCRRVLRDKHRMPLPRCLPSIPRGMGRGKTFCNKILPVQQNRAFSFFIQIDAFLRAQMKPAAKSGAGQPVPQISRYGR